MKPTRLPLAFTPSPAPLPSAIRGALPATQAGFGLLETVIVGTFGVALLSAAVMTYNHATATQKVAREADHVGALFKATTNVYASRASFDGLSTSGAVAGGIFPPDLLDATANPVNPWGGAVSVAAQADPNDPAGSPVRGFTIAYSNVPPSVCATLAASAGSGFSLVTVRSASQGGSTPAAAHTSAVIIRPPGPPPVDLYAGSVMSTTQAGRVDPTLATQNCANSLNTVAFTYFKSGATTSASCTTTPVPPPDVGNRTQPCPGGGQDLLPFAPYASSWAQSQSRDYTCNASGTVDVGPWSPWSPNYGCVARCSAPPSSTATATRACPAGQIDSQAPYTAKGITDTTTTTWTCPLPIGSATSSASTTTQNRCAPQCIAPAPTTATQTVPCVAPTTGSWTQTRTTTWTCPAATGSATSSTGLWSPTSAPAGACITPPPACTPTPPAYNNAGCPAGYTGSHWQRSDWTCPPAPGAWSAWYDWGANTCAAPPPVCTWPLAPNATPMCPAPNASTPQTGGWIHAATCPNWQWNQTAPCPPSACTNPAPATTPACSVGNQTGGTWVPGVYPSCTWTYTGGSCPAPLTYRWVLTGSQDNTGSGGMGQAFYTCGWSIPDAWGNIPQYSWDPGACTVANAGAQYVCALLVPDSRDDLHDDTFTCQLGP